MTPVTQALDDVRVVEFGGYAAGPHIGKILANFGATVIHVESLARPDGFRLQYPPFKGGAPGVDAGGCFAFFNDSKFDVTLDLKKSEGVSLARRLARWADVIIENMRPGVMDRLGLGYAPLAADNPRLVMLSTCNMGQSGPRANTPGFGSQLSALAGMCGLIGRRDGPPMLLYGPYIDFIASALGAAAVLAALENRRSSGAGAHLDVSQYESGLMFLAGPLLDYALNGRVAERAGNSDPVAALHAAYPCAGDTWVALSCWSDEEIERLLHLIGREDLIGTLNPAPGIPNPEPGTRNPIASALDTWTRERTASDAAEALQAAGIRAHAVNSVADLFSDPQLVSRHQWRRRRHPVIGDQAYLFPPFDLCGLPGDITAAAPVLGADNERVFGEFLGLPGEEIERLRAAGAFD